MIFDLGFPSTRRTNKLKEKYKDLFDKFTITEDEHGLHIEINNLDDIFMVIFLAGEDVIISRKGIGNYTLYVYDDYME